MRRPRKQPEPALPGKYIRSSGGTPARLVKTRHLNAEDEWLYRLDFGRVTGQGLYSQTDLRDDGCTFLTERPDDLPERLPKGWPAVQEGEEIEA